MTILLILSAVVIIIGVLCNKVSSKFGIPMLLIFILLGMLFGSDGLLKINFDNYEFAENICSVALVFIMFYGGFGTRWSKAKSVVVKSIMLSSLGTVITAGLVGLFCYYILNIALLESFLIGAVISSTDAASVFSVLRSKRLNLKYNTASLLEIESGSNDPFSYMLTIIVLSLMNGDFTGGKFVYMLFSQITFGLLFGFGIAGLTVLFLKKFKFSSDGFNSIFIVAVAIISFAASSYFGGNGYLSTYITGIILGNCKINNKIELVHFFNGVTGFMQMLLFFLLGLLSFPSQLPGVAIPALCIALFLTFIARPIAVFLILSPFKSRLKQMFLVSWTGMRGAASIVFAIMIVTNPAVTDNDIFHIVFFIVLFSILLQGALTPFIAKKLKMTDSESDVMKTFTDYMDEVPAQFIQFTVPDAHPWVEKKIENIILPPDSIIVLIIRKKQKIIPNGKTMVFADDIIILSGKPTDKIEGVQLYEKTMENGDDWVGRRILDINSGHKLIMLIKRGETAVIPKGNTVLMENDVLVITDV